MLRQKKKAKGNALPKKEKSRRKCSNSKAINLEGNIPYLSHLHFLKEIKNRAHGR